MNLPTAEFLISLFVLRSLLMSNWEMEHTGKFPKWNAMENLVPASKELHALLLQLASERDLAKLIKGPFM